MHCTHPKPTNQALYNRIKAQVKSRVKRWPSAYASGQLVRSYKQKGGKYSCNGFGNSFGSLDRWFKEKWVNVCTGKPCGRKKSSSKNYPYCRPSRRISSQTPRTSREISRAELKRRCALKRKIKGKTMKSKFGKFVLNTQQTLRKHKINNLILDLRKLTNLRRKRRN